MKKCATIYLLICLILWVATIFIAGTSVQATADQAASGQVVAGRAISSKVASSQAAAGQTASGSAPSSAFDPQAVLQRYCVTCHNDRLKTAGLSFSSMDVS